MENIADKNFEALIDNILKNITKEIPWGYFTKPLLLFYTRKLYENINLSKIVENKDEFMKFSIYEIVKRLNEVYLRVLIAEINKLSKEDKLIGETPKERGTYFRDVFLRKDRYLENVYTFYPELTRLLKNSVENQVDFICKIINDTNEKKIEIYNEYNMDTKDKLKRIKLQSGDTHNKGKSVSLLIFTSGKKLVYKPRNVEIDRAYNELISFLNNSSIKGYHNLYSPKVVSNKGRGGWQEFIEYKECNTNEEVNNFYRRVGEILCIIYLFNGRDFHYENIIANGEYPVLIDLETLLNPRIYENFNENNSFDMVNKLVSESIYFSGLLPRKIVSKKNHNIIDLAGLSMANEAKAQYKTMVIENYDTDEVKIVKRYINIKPKNNNPKLRNEVVKSEEYIEKIEEGFINFYRWIINNKVLLKNKIKQCFSNKECRVVIRGTMVYSQILNTSYHPQLLKNTIDRKVYLSRIGISLNETISRFLPKEYEDIQQGDIPYFTVNTSENNFYNKDIKVSIIDEIINKIDSFNKLDLDRQISILYMSFEDKIRRNYATKNKFLDTNTTYKEIKNININVAKKIGDYVIKKGIYGKNKKEVSWLALRMVKGNIMSIMDAGFDLYEGNAGIGLFLAYLSKFIKDKEIENIVMSTIKPIINHIKDEKKIGFFNGLSGELYSLFKIGKILNKEELIGVVYKNIPYLKTLIDSNGNIDITSGYSGNLLFIISIYKEVKDATLKEELLGLMELIYKKIKNKAIRNKFGVTWSEDGLIGFAHGNVGIESALIKYYNITRKEEILELIREGVNFDRSLFDKEKGGWPRAAINYNIYSNFWCHGNGGILLSRLLLKEENFEYKYLDEEINFCINELITKGIGGDYSLCHGDTGNLLILYKAAILLKDKGLKERVLGTFKIYMDKIIEDNIIEEDFKFKENNSLMIGLSGIGYGILKFLYYDEVPDILILE